MISIEQSLGLVIDIQGRLVPAMANADTLVGIWPKLVGGLLQLNVPIIATEQAPQKLGPTLSTIDQIIPSPALPKTTFSAWADSACQAAIQQANRFTIILLGIETHVCVFQTAVHLKQAGYRVVVVENAVTSRFLYDHASAIASLRAMGIDCWTIEMVLMALVGDASRPEFKQCLSLIK